MVTDLSGKMAVVTGSTDGIGFAVAKGLALAGASVVLNGRTPAKVAASVATIGCRARGFAADLSTPDGHAALVDAEPIADIVVSNLGIFVPKDFFDTDDAAWDRHWQTNVMAGVRLARGYLPAMERRGWGRFLLLGSESAFIIPDNMIHYGVTKTADVALARGLAKRMAGTNVTVNSVLLGPTLSEGVAAMLEGERESTGRPLEELAADFVKSHRPSSIIRRTATVEEVANMVVYLASLQASATTGASVRADGGVINTI